MLLGKFVTFAENPGLPTSVPTDQLFINEFAGRILGSFNTKE